MTAVEANSYASIQKYVDRESYKEKKIEIFLMTSLMSTIRYHVIRDVKRTSLAGHASCGFENVIYIGQLSVAVSVKATRGARSFHTCYCADHSGSVWKCFRFVEQNTESAYIFQVQLFRIKMWKKNAVKKFRLNTQCCSLHYCNCCCKAGSYVVFFLFVVCSWAITNADETGGASFRTILARASPP